LRLQSLRDGHVDCESSAHDDLPHVHPTCTRRDAHFSGLEALERDVVKRIRAEWADAEWLHRFAVLGPYDYVDLFRVPSVDVATKISTLVRTCPRSTFPNRRIVSQSMTHGASAARRHGRSVTG
jgi:hypothetical protein